MSYLRKKTFTVLASLFILFLTSLSHAYAKDAYFDISFDRSVGITAPEGQKNITAIGDSVTLSKKGRLWMTGNETTEGFVEIVCQNLSTEPVTVELANTQSPWFNITGQNQCSNWNKNILICPVGKLQKGVFCKSTERIASATGGGTEKLLSASVNIRALNVQSGNESNRSEQKYLEDRVDFYAAGIDLCGIIFEKKSDIFINWIIYDGGTIEKVEIDSKTSSKDSELASCIVEQITYWRFPEWENDSQISYQF